MTMDNATTSFCRVAMQPCLERALHGTDCSTVKVKANTGQVTDHVLKTLSNCFVVVVIE